jgi:hypothetical protein
MKKVIVFSLIVLLIINSCAQEKKSPIKGVWKITEISYNSPDTSWIRTSPQPSLWFFGKGYYSIMHINGNEPRPLQPDGTARSALTDEQIRSNYMGFTGNSGKYELNGSKLITHPIVALNPNLMTGGSWEFEYKVEDNTLWLTGTDASIVTVYKFTLLER